MIAAGGFFLFCLIISWVFGREFADGTLKDMLAVPVPRASILLAKFIVAAVWSAALAVRDLRRRPGHGRAHRAAAGARRSVLLQGSALVAVTACLVIVVVTALCALRQRRPRLPAAHRRGDPRPDDGQPGGGLGWGEYFPWAVPGLYAQGKERPAADQLSRSCS